ncbi:MAG TPA: tetratricopeptide repeat protein, partial [Anaerolineae bacterium]
EGLRAIFGEQARLIRPIIDFALAEVRPDLDYYYLPAPVRSYAERKLPEGAIGAVGRRALKHYHSVADAYNDIILAGKDELGVALFFAEFPNFEEFLAWGYAGETSDAEPPVCYSARITALFRNAFIYLDPAGTQLPRYQTALEAARRVGDQSGEANVLQAIGDVQNFRKEIDAALASYGEALKLFRAVGDRLGEANVLQAIGDVQNFRDERDAALASYGEALKLFRAVGDRLGEANVFLSTGRMALQAGDDQHGIEWLEHAGKIYEEIGAQSGWANVRIALAQHMAAKGNWQAAIDYMQPAADFGKRIRHPLGDQLQAQIDEWRQRMGVADD